MSWHGVGKASCPVTVGGHVTGVDVSITIGTNFASVREFLCGPEALVG